MKTNVIMIREEDQFKVLQRTKDGFVNATDVVKKFNKLSILKKDKEVSRFLALDSTKDIIKHLQIRTKIKNLYIAKRLNKGDESGTWMHPVLFGFMCIWLGYDYILLFNTFLSKGIIKYPDFDFQKIVSKSVSIKKTYLMIDENTGLVKIGRSNNPVKREKTLQSEKPTISLLAVSELDSECELHKKYKSKNVRGEWFDLSSHELSQLIKKYKFKII